MTDEIASLDQAYLEANNDPAQIESKKDWGIGPFDPGPFYKEKEIKQILEEYHANTCGYPKCAELEFHSSQLALKITKYLDENYNREKNGMDQR